MNKNIRISFIVLSLITKNLRIKNNYYMRSENYRNCFCSQYLCDTSRYITSIKLFLILLIGANLNNYEN